MRWSPTQVVVQFKVTPFLLANTNADFHMEDDPREVIKSFIFGIVMPVVMVLFAVDHLIFRDATSGRRTHLQPHQVTGVGLWKLGLAVIFHAWGLRAYENRPLLRFVLFVLGGVLVAVGFSMEVRLLSPPM